MTVDQHPVQRGIADNADQQHRHYGTNLRQRSKQAAQHRKAEKRRPAPGNRPQKAADLGDQHGIVPQCPEQRGQTGQHGDQGQRQQHGQHQSGAGDAPRRVAITAAQCVRGERRHGGKDPLQHDPAGEIKHRAEPGGGQRHRAEPSDHHCVGDAHRHLREIGRGERRRQRQGRAEFRANARGSSPAPLPIGWIDRFHLSLSQLRHGEPADPRERPSKRKGPDRYRRGPVVPRVRSVQRTRIPSGPTAKPRGSAVLIEYGNAQIIGGL